MIDMVKGAAAHGPVDVECAGKFGVWAATRHAGYERVVHDEVGREVSREHRRVRGWDVTHVPSGIAIPIKVSRPVALFLAREFAARWPKFGARWKFGHVSYSPSNLATLGEIRAYVEAQGVETWKVPVAR